jgi:hypothetical protein
MGLAGLPFTTNGCSVTIRPVTILLTKFPKVMLIARWRLLQALDAAAVGGADPNDETK